MKVKINNKILLKNFFDQISIIGTLLGLILAFFPIESEIQFLLGTIFLFSLIVLYIMDWYKANQKTSILLKIDQTIINIKEGDIFEESDLKVIAFNEYFDTDQSIISKTSLNGIFLEKLESKKGIFENQLTAFCSQSSETFGKTIGRKIGKERKFHLGTIFEYDSYLLTAFSKFDSKNKAHLSLKEYQLFLINFWDNLNNIYDQRSVVVPILGSGITRIEHNKNISDEELLKTMLWSFKMSEMRFKYPSELTIIIHKDKIKNINLLNIQ